MVVIPLGAMMRLFIILFILFACPALLASCPYPPWEQTVRLKTINDGDTVTLEDGRLVRFIGINTPEINHGNLAKSEPYALEAKALLARYIHPGDKLHLVFDQTKQDKYGRLLAYVYSKTGRNLALLLLQKGYAKQWVIGKNDRFWRCFQDAERPARKRKRGVWKEFKALSASRLQNTDKGYTYIKGRISDIQATNGGLRLILDRHLLVTISRSNLSLFKKSGVQFVLHEKLLLSGKLIFSQGKPKMSLYHPVQILR